MTDDAEKMTPMQKLVLEQIAPLMEKASDIATKNGVPLFCVVQTTSVVTGQVELATGSSHVRYFCHPASMRFLIDFYHSCKDDPADADWLPGQRSLADGFVNMGAMWATASSELLRRLAVASAFVIAQGFTELPDHLIEKTRNALSGLVGPAAAQDFYAAIDELKSRSRVAGSRFTVVEIPSGLPEPAGRN
ncbi:MAG TPA: hypothetical protein PLW65_18025 [Pseudomonadota bacterium]|nr:hypothetical protein [Pseudomonadota bacterium]